jgi:hypothetical protein
MYPAPKYYVTVGIIEPIGYGVMPCGDVKTFYSYKQYSNAYDAELDEFVDEMFRLEQENELEFPEDYALCK